MSGGKVGLIRNILSPGDNTSEKMLIVEWFRGHPNNFFTEPVLSSDLKIFKVSQKQGDIAAIMLTEVTCKCVLVPFQDQYVVIHH